MNRNQHIQHTRMFATQLVYDETLAYGNVPLVKYVDGRLLPAMADITYVYQSMLSVVDMSQSQAYTGWRGYVSTAIARELSRSL